MKRPVLALVGVAAAALAMAAIASATISGSDEADSNATPTSVSPDGVIVPRVLPAAVSAGADIDTNLLPSVPVHDLHRGTTGNFRNIFPSDRAVLLWMWAPY